MTKTIDINGLQDVTDLIDLTKTGDEVIIVDGETPLARLTGLSAAPEKSSNRIAGLHPGTAWMSEDFDQPLPDDFWASGQ